MEKRGGKIPFIKNEEAYVADDFWDLNWFSNTTEFIFGIFKELGDEGFGDQFNKIFETPSKK